MSKHLLCLLVLLAVLALGIALWPGQGPALPSPTDPDEASEARASVADDEPNESPNWWLLMNRGIAYGQQGDNQEALEQFDLALAKSPPPEYAARIHLIAAVMYLGSCARERGDMELKLALATAPDDPEILAGSASVALDFGNYRDAMVAFSNAVTAAGKRANRSHYGNALRQRGQALFRLGQYDEAITDFAADLEAPLLESYRNMAALQFAIGDYGAARSTCAAAVQLWPAHGGDVECLMSLIDVCEGRRTWSEMPTSARPGLKGIAEFASGNVTAAFAIFDRIVATNPCPGRAVLVEPFIWTIPDIYGMFLCAVDQSLAGLKMARLALQEVKVPSFSWAVFAACAGSGSEEQQYRAEIAAILKQFPENYWYVRLTRLSLGETSLEQTVATLDRSDPVMESRRSEAYYIAGEIALRAADPENARKHFEAVIRLAPACSFAQILASTRLRNLEKRK